MTTDTALTSALTQSVEATPSQDAPQSEFLSTLVGEGRKFTESEQLAKSYHHANIHIEELKGELEEAKQSKNLMQEVLDELRKEPEVIDRPVHKDTADTHSSTDDIAKIIDAEFSKRNSATKAQANVAASMKALSGIYGGDKEALAAVNTAINGDDSIKKVIDDLSRANPEAVVKFVNGVVPQGDKPLVSNTPGIQTPSANAVAASNGGLSWTECREIKKKDPSRYNSAAFRTSIEQAVASNEAAGIDFFAT